MPEAVRLYLDEDVMSRDLVNALRSRAVDLITAKEAGLIHIPDSQHLEYATAQGRTLVTYNTRDYARLHAEYHASDRHHAGIIRLGSSPSRCAGQAPAQTAEHVHGG